MDEDCFEEEELYQEYLYFKYEDELKEQIKENERLNNIINEIEKMIKNDLEWACSMNENGLFNGAIDMLEVYLDKIQKLKGNESNGR